MAASTLSGERTSWAPRSAATPRARRASVIASARLAREVLLQRLDALRDDAHELVDFVACDAERRCGPEYRAARVDDRAALPRLTVELRHVRGVERAARTVGCHHVDAHHQAAAADLADDPPLADGGLQLVEQTRAH